MPDIQAVGAGPAGSAAAIAALSDGAGVRIVERSRAPRHKVCGEFIPAEACAELERLGVWDEVRQADAPRIRRCVLHFGKRSKQWRFDEPGMGLSRRLLDRLLLDRAAAMGAAVSRGTVWRPGEASAERVVLAAGRNRIGPARRRLFGFKAHFYGPVDDSVELYFTPWGYCGVSAVEGGVTNICGLAPEDVLRRHNFQIEELLAGHAPLASRLRPLSRRMAWLHTGPLYFSRPAPDGSVYPAGDALDS